MRRMKVEERRWKWILFHLNYHTSLFPMDEVWKGFFKDEKTENVDSEFEKGIKSVREEKKLTNELI